MMYKSKQQVKSGHCNTTMHRDKLAEYMDLKHPGFPKKETETGGHIQTSVVLMFGNKRMSQPVDPTEVCIILAE